MKKSASLFLLFALSPLYAAHLTGSELEEVMALPDLTKPGTSANITGENYAAEKGEVVNAFDNNATSRVMAKSKTTFTITYSFDEATVVNAYSLQLSGNGYDRNNAKRAPKAFTLSGLDEDSGEWVVLGTEDSETNWDANAIEKRYFLANPDKLAFKTYKWSLVQNNGDDWTALGEIELFFRTALQTYTFLSPGAGSSADLLTVASWDTGALPPENVEVLFPSADAYTVTADSDVSYYQMVFNAGSVDLALGSSAVTVTGLIKIGVDDATDSPTVTLSSGTLAATAVPTKLGGDTYPATLTITGADTVYKSLGIQANTGSSVTLSAGARWENSGQLLIGESSDNNSLVVTDPGTLLTLGAGEDLTTPISGANIIVGQFGSSNTMSLLNGARVEMPGTDQSYLQVGVKPDAKNNLFTISGEGSTLFGGKVSSFAAGSDNRIVIEKGGRMVVTNYFTCGTFSTAKNNNFYVRDGGNLTLTDSRNRAILRYPGQTLTVTDPNSSADFDLLLVKDGATLYVQNGATNSYTGELLIDDGASTSTPKAVFDNAILATSQMITINKKGEMHFKNGSKYTKTGSRMTISGGKLYASDEGTTITSGNLWLQSTGALARFENKANVSSGDLRFGRYGSSVGHEALVEILSGATLTIGGYISTDINDSNVNAESGVVGSNALIRVSSATLNANNIFNMRKNMTLELSGTETFVNCGTDLNISDTSAIHFIPSVASSKRTSAYIHVAGTVTFNDTAKISVPAEEAELFMKNGGGRILLLSSDNTLGTPENIVFDLPEGVSADVSDREIALHFACKQGTLITIY